MSPVYKFSNVGGFLTKNLYTSALAGNPTVVLDKGSMYPLGVFTLASAQTDIDFTNIPQTYTHLQLRYSLLGNALQYSMRLNNDSASNYSMHQMTGNGASIGVGAATSTTQILLNFLTATSTTNPTVGVIDILDYKNTNKNKTIRNFNGLDNNGSGQVTFGSGLWMSTNAITSIKMLGAFTANSSFALYGIQA